MTSKPAASVSFLEPSHCENRTDNLQNYFRPNLHAIFSAAWNYTLGHGDRKRKFAHHRAEIREVSVVVKSAMVVQFLQG